MKRIFTFGLMLASVFALTNCTEELVDPTIPKDEVTQETTTPEGEGIPFQVYASLGPETKTEGYSDGGVLKTKWVAGDKISVFYAKVTDGVEGALTPAPTMFEITADNLDKTMFTGQVGTDFDENATYNWYFVYDATKTSRATENPTSVTISAAGQTQNISTDTNTEMKHIGSTNCPMWGKALNVSGTIKPRIQMKHLASLYKLTIQNQTNNTEKPSNAIASYGNITVYDVGMRVRTSGVWLEDNKQKALFGNFNLDVKTGELKQDQNNTNYTINLNLSEEVELIPGNEHTFYFVAAPVDIQTKETKETRYQKKDDAGTIITKEDYDAIVKKDKESDPPTNEANNYKAITVTTRLDVLEFLVNGSARPLPARNAFAFANGAVYKYTLPVWRMSHPYESDAFNLKSVGTPINEVAHVVENVITTSAEGTTTINVNGQNVPAYVIGDEAGNTGTVSITGFADDLFDALPIGFYTSAWNNEPAEMTVKEVIVNAPVFYEETTSSTEDIKLNSDNRPIERLITNKLTVDFTELESRDGEVEIKVLGFPVNIPLNLNRDMLGMLGGSVLEKITFSGMPAQGRYDDANDSHNVIVMNEAYSYKEITNANMDTFIQNFGKGASMSGVEEILSISDEYLPESYTITEVKRKTNDWESYWLFGTHWRETNVVEKVESVTVEPTWPGSLQDTHPNLVSTVNTVYNLLLSKSLNFYNIATVTLAGMDGLIPSQWHLIYYLREALLNVTLTTTENGPRMIFWGLDAMGPNQSPQNN